jgi:hypothetical protein
MIENAYICFNRGKMKNKGRKLGVRVISVDNVVLSGYEVTFCARTEFTLEASARAPCPVHYGT